MIWDELLTPEQRALADCMSDISEDCECAQWMSGCEFTLWRALVGGVATPWTMGEITAGNIADLQRLSDACGGWIAYDDGLGGLAFVPLEDWKRTYAEAVLS